MAIENRRQDKRVMDTEDRRQDNRVMVTEDRRQDNRVMVTEDRQVGFLGDRDDFRKLSFGGDVIGTSAIWNNLVSAPTAP